MPAESHRLAATELLKAFNDNQLTIEDYAKSLLKRIEERDGVVKAWAYLKPEQVLEQARALDKVPKDQRGPLHGIGVAIKDVIYTRGTSSCFPSRWSIRTDTYRHADAARLTHLRERSTRGRCSKCQDASLRWCSNLRQDDDNRIRRKYCWHKDDQSA